MRRYMSVKRLGALVLAAVLSVSAAFVSEAAASYKAEVPVTLHLDVNSRRTTIYDGYSSYLLGYRVSEYDTFTVTKDKSDVDLNEVTLNYYLVTYRGETQKYLECTVYGLKEGTHYPVIRPETVEKERSVEGDYNYLDQCYMVEFCYQDKKESRYFMLLPEEDMGNYRNILLGKWNKDMRGWRYLYQDEYLTSWALINDKWYFFNTDGYMQTGWLEYKGQWYYMDPENGVMQTNRTIDGYQLDNLRPGRQWFLSLGTGFETGKGQYKRRWGSVFREDAAPLSLRGYGSMEQGERHVPRDSYVQLTRTKSPGAPAVS